jgi:aspartyl-tRNA(Asn)/glutamyl-tRNA(Gln) amidotransferase subunit C
MLAFVEKLNEINTDAIQPLIYMSDELNVLRDDVVIQNITQDEALKNSPKHDSDYFKVPKMIDK